ncbi:MAG TPA: pilus assembly protein PilM [Candidatus Paceibacterota bacterium]|nr:pilus assembly protein PilM [Candidatus Paceibacterota bacterium]HRZ34528.1 pilus assembly protein PilM [Candidatus Paceibacterota bacterium]
MFDKKKTEEKKAPVEKTAEKTIEKKEDLDSVRKTSLRSFAKRKIDSAFGMSISDSSIELLEFRPFLTHKPSSYSRITLEEGIVLRGKIIDKDRLVDKIKTLLLNAKPGKVSTNRVVLSLPEEQVFTWSVAISRSISGSELRAKILEEAKKIVPLDFKKVYWDFVSYPLRQKELQYVTFVGISRDILDGYFNVCSELGLEVVDFSLESMSLARVFLPPSDKDDYVLLNIGGETSTVSIIGGNQLLKLSFTLPLAGDAITDAIAKSLNVTKLEAEQLKMKFGVGDSPNPSYKTAVESVLNELLKQVSEAIAYYEKNSGETVDAIYLTGGSSLLNGLDGYVAQQTGKNIQALASLPFIVRSPIFKKEINIKLFADAVGLAIIGISQDYKILSFRKQISIKGSKPSFFKKLRSGYFSKTKMIFSPAHITYGLLFLLIVGLTTVFTLMWLNIRQG